MSTVRKVPLRKCIGCNEMKNKKEMIRVVKTPAACRCVSGSRDAGDECDAEEAGAWHDDPDGVQERGSLRTGKADR